MKTLEEKKLLVKMAKMLGQPVDQALVESIEREERLSKILFKEEKKEEPKIIGYEKETTFLNRKPIFKEPTILVEADPVPPEPVIPPPAPAFTPPVANTIQAVMNVLATANTPNTNIYRDKEIEGMRRSIAEMMQKISTMSWGGGGTGIVRLYDGDDFDRASIVDDRQFVKFKDGYFKLDYINPKEIVANTVYVTSNTYQITADDYYIGVNVASTVTITLPSSADVFTGREFYVKDESGNAGAPARFIDIYPSGSDKIDNQNYVRLQIDNGGLKFIYRNGWRVI